ncbi:MAG: hypothetical protein H6851_10195 [Geminicoccaceae bacterium]|nr:hypothetical protein [Geminicoccaceae bacterium]MCB9943977.1 hypothetical protein [Geminicoccaceae bacterium]
MKQLRIGSTMVARRSTFGLAIGLSVLMTPRWATCGEPGIIHVSGRPTVGAHYHYVVERSRNLVIDGMSDVRDAQASASLDVVRERPDGLQFSWTLEQVTIAGSADLDVENITSQLTAQLTDFPVVYWTDPAGSMIEITNFERLRDRLDAGTGRMIDRVTATMKDDGATDTQIEGARKLIVDIQQMLISQPASQLGFQLLPEASLATYAFNMSLKLDRAVIYSREEPSPLGGPPLALAGELKAVDLDPEKGLVTIRWNESFAPDAVESFIHDFGRMIEERASEDMRGDLLEQFHAIARNMTIERRGELLVDLADGMTVRGAVHKETMLGMSRRIDEMSIRREP